MQPTPPPPSNASPESVLPWRQLALLSVGVALAHLAVLGGLGRLHITPGASSEPPMRSLAVRSLEAAREGAAAVPVPAVPPPARATVRPRPKPADSPTSELRQAVDKAQQAPIAPDSVAPSIPDGSATQAVTAALQAPAPVSAPAATGAAAAEEPSHPAARPVRETRQQPGRLQLPRSTRLAYEIAANKFPFNAQAELQWRTDGRSYSALLELRKFVLVRSQSSNGSVDADGLAPLRFSDKTRSEQAAHFERDRGRVLFSANTPDAPLLAGAQDRLSLLLQLAAMVSGEPEKYPTATTISLQVVGAREADIWLFTVGEWQTLDFAGSSMNTLKLTRNPRQPYDQRVELWLAPDLDYLPARVRITEANGDFIDQQWRATLAP